MRAMGTKFRRALFAVIVLLLTLTACGGGAGPEKPVEDFLEAVQDLDVEKAAGLVCEKYRDDTQADLETLSDLVDEIEIVGLVLELENKKDDEATVTVTGGNMSLTTQGKASEERDLVQEFKTIKVVKQDGKWLVCDQAFLLGDPKKPVADFFAALEDLDAAKAAGVVCEQYRHGTQAGLESLLDLPGAKVEIVDLELAVEDRQDDEATVVTAGSRIRLSVGGETPEETELAKDFEVVKVIKEDARWLVCDEASLFGGPKKPVADFFMAFAEFDAEKMAATVCEEYRDDVEAGLEMTFDYLEVAADEAGLELTIEIIDLELEVRDKKDDVAMIILVAGKIKLTMGDIQEDTDVSDGTEAIKVIKQDGKWRICDEALVGDFAP